MKRKIFMDSGAFTAFTQGESLSLARYCQWLNRYKRYLDYYAVLDVIGDPQATWDNQRRMEDAGLDPVPCYHHGEDVEWLERYIDGYDYVAIGGMVPVGKQQLGEWLDDLWGTHLSNDKGEPICRVHGFGMTTFSLMERYPWFSVDSSSWLFGAKAGACLFNVNGTMTRITVAHDSPSRAEAGQHFETLTRDEQARIVKELNHHGFKSDEVFTSGVARNLVNIKQFDLWAKRWKRPFCPFRPSLFHSERVHSCLKPPPLWEKLDLYFAAERGGIEEKALLPYNRMFTYYAQQKKLSRDFRYVCNVMDGKVSDDDALP